MHTGLLSFFLFFAEKHWQAAGMKALWCGEGGEKALSVDAESLTTSHPPDGKSATLLLKV